MTRWKYTKNPIGFEFANRVINDIYHRSIYFDSFYIAYIFYTEKLMIKKKEGEKRWERSYWDHCIAICHVLGTCQYWMAERFQVVRVLHYWNSLHEDFPSERKRIELEISISVSRKWTVSGGKRTRNWSRTNSNILFVEVQNPTNSLETETGNVSM